MTARPSGSKAFGHHKYKCALSPAIVEIGILMISRIFITNSSIDGKKYIYHDTYFGGTKFAGEEVVYIDNHTYWAMNYYGVTLDETLCEEAMDNALRPALMNVGEDKTVIPVRGPKEFINGEYKYTFEVNGDINCFNGIETIYKNNVKIYELRCNGGLIK
jgi:hypothetical protein